MLSRAHVPFGDLVAVSQVNPRRVPNVSQFNQLKANGSRNTTKRTGAQNALKVFWVAKLYKFFRL